MPKFFVNQDDLNLEENTITIHGQDVNHIANVLRLKIDDKIEIGVKKDIPESFFTNIKEIKQDKVICDIIQKNDISKESNISLTIFQGIPKSDKMEFIIQKCTELGASDFVPLELKRCIAKIEGKDAVKKIDRWQKIAEAATKQSGRDIIPVVKEKTNLKNLCNSINEYDLVIVAYEQEKEYTLKEILTIDKKISKIAIVIGPEGGFEIEEIEMLKTAGASIVSLGNRILRTETAPIVLTSIIMYELGGF